MFFNYEKFKKVRNSELFSAFHQIGTYYENLTDRSKKALITDSKILPVMSLLAKKKGLMTFTVLKERIISDLVGFEMAMNSFMYKAYNDKIIQITEAGFSEKIAEVSLPKQEESDTQISLSLDHLLIWFQLWGCCLLVSALVFIFEVFMSKIHLKILKLMHKNRPFIH